MFIQRNACAALLPIKNRTPHTSISSSSSPASVVITYGKSNGPPLSANRITLPPLRAELALDFRLGALVVIRNASIVCARARADPGGLDRPDPARLEPSRVFVPLETFLDASVVRRALEGAVRTVPSLPLAESSDESRWELKPPL